MAKKFKAHMMYGKDGQKEHAATLGDHERLSKTDINLHSPPPFKLREVHYASPLKCWKSHERKPGTTEGAKGSCQHKDPSQRPK